MIQEESFRILISIIAALGIGGIFLAVLNRYWKNKDEQSENTNIQNLGEIEDRDKFRKGLLEHIEAQDERIENLEGKYDAMFSRNIDLVKKNGELEAVERELIKENSQLKEVNARQEKTIIKQQTEITDLKKRVSDLEKIVDEFIKPK